MNTDEFTLIGRKNSSSYHYIVNLVFSQAVIMNLIIGNSFIEDIRLKCIIRRKQQEV